MEHKDLLEDIVLAVLVASTTVATLYAGWRTGRAARTPDATEATPGAGADPRMSVAAEPDGRRESLAAWTRRLAGEGARSARHGSPATIVAVRLGPPRGPLARRSESEIGRMVEAAEAVALASRASDVIKVTADGIIRILLVETTEDGAHQFVDRVSPALREHASTGGREVVAAWASMAPSRDLLAADRLAVARLRGATVGWLRSLAVHHTGGGTGTEATPAPEGPRELPVEEVPG